jgi:PAS domain S-box-containing protein
MIEHVRAKNEEVQRWLEAYQTAVDINIISSITDETGKILQVNNKFCEVSGFSRAELLGQTHRIINSGYHPREFFEHMWLTIRSGKTWRGEIRNKTRNGEYYWVDTVILPVNFDNSTRFLSLRMLITDRKEFEEKSAAYVQALEELLFITSHRLRSPLTSILGLVQLTVEKPPTADPEKILSHIKTSARELDRITREMTEYISYLRKQL